MYITTMNKCKQKVFWIALLSLCHRVLTEATNAEARNETKEELTAAEAKDRLDIVKSIKKINDDGSYTIGYEADDGSFKIESRDVLGNIKGTYGYVDDGGAVKRVSYTSRNFSDLITEAPSVVQRIPKIVEKVSTRTPGILAYNPTTVPTQTTTRRVVTTTAPTTASGPTRFIHFPTRTLLRTTAPQQDVQKSEGQIIRPEVSTVRSTEAPALKNVIEKVVVHHNQEEKPVTEESEIKESNLLRRQLPQEFDPVQHVTHLQQGLGDDAVDVYAGSHTARPLFTTTIRPRGAISTPVVHIKPKVHTTTEPAIRENVISEATSHEPSPAQSPSSATVYQVQQPPVVALRHPYQNGFVLMPINQFNSQPQVFVPNPQYIRQIVTPTQFPEHHQISNPVYIQRQPPPLLRQIPVQFEDNNYVQPIHQHQVQAIPRVDEIANEVDHIRPPVSIRDFQKIIELLSLRQTRLEQANALLFAHLNNRPTHAPAFLTPTPDYGHQNPEHPRYIPVVRQIQQEHPNDYLPTASSYTPTRRVARLLRSKPPPDEEGANDDPEYLPSQVREMLLLRMLQLAINPSLPIHGTSTEIQDASTPIPQFVKTSGVRNVEILGEEDESENQRQSRNTNGNYKGRY